MSAILTRERATPSLSLAMPLSAPSLEAAEDLLMFMASEVLSPGTTRRRQRGAGPAPGRRSDFGYVVFHRAPGEGPHQLSAFKTVPAIRSYLVGNLDAPAADHWAALQSTQWRARRDGKILPTGFTADQTRHLLGVVVDLDGSRMDPLLRRLLLEDIYAFMAALGDRLDQLGIDHYRLIRSGPEGVHVHLPIRRPDGKCLRATEKNVQTWERVAMGLHRFLERFGADANACKLTQPFAIPGLPRAKHPGFIPHLIGGRDGAQSDLYTLLRTLAAMKVVPSRGRAIPSPAPSVPSEEATVILEAVRNQAAGVSESSPSRNQVAHDLAIFLLCKGATEEAAWDALTVWNERNSPPLSGRELRDCFRSALRCPSRYPRQWAEMQQAAWVRLRGLLGLPAAPATGYRQGGRWRPLTPRKDWEQRKRGGGREHFPEVEERVLRLVGGEGGRVEMTQQAIANMVDTNRSTLKAILERLAASGQLVVSARRGCGGRTVLSLPVAIPAAAPEGSEVNGQSRISTVGVKQGERVGSPSSAPFQGSAEEREHVNEFTNEGAPAPVEVLARVIDGALGLELYGYVPVPLVMVLRDAGAGWRIVARNEIGDMLLKLLGERRWWMAELERQLGCAVILNRDSWRPVEPEEDPIGRYTGPRA